MLRHIVSGLQELVFPSYCLHCGQRLPCRELPLLCPECLALTAYLHSPQCSCCGVPFPAGRDHHCGLCLQQKYAFDQARAAVYYREPITSMISSLKFNGSLIGLATLAHLARNSEAIKNLTTPDMILPVPLHKKRLRQRKFNQAGLLASNCFPELQRIIRTDVLFRSRQTQPQTGLSGKERRKNLSKAFSLKKTPEVKGKNILLIDDVFTTGSTVNECAKVLRKAGAKQIEVFTLARAI